MTCPTAHEMSHCARGNCYITREEGASSRAHLFVRGIAHSPTAMLLGRQIFIGVTIIVQTRTTVPVFVHWYSDGPRSAVSGLS